VVSIEGLNIRRGHTAVDLLLQGFGEYVQSYVGRHGTVVRAS